MNMNQTIVDLLYRYECVIISGFGGFVTQHKPAKFDPIGYYFSPSTKKVGFNSNLLQTDGLLENTLAKIHGISYKEASEYISKNVAEWKVSLKNTAAFSIDGLGVFTKENDNLIFTPEEQLNFNLNNYGFQKIKATYILKENKKLTQESSSNSWGSYVASIGFALLIGGGGFFANQQLVNTQFSSILPIIKTESFEQNTEVKQNAPIIDIENVNESEQIVNQPNSIVEVSVLSDIEETQIEQKEELDLSIRPYQVIGGSFKNYSKAMKHEAFLRAKGYEKSRIIGKVGNFFMVAFDTFNSEEEALEYKRELERKGKDVFIREQS